MIPDSSQLLRQFHWLQHGFGTRHAPLSQDGMVSLKQIHSSLVLTAGAAAEGNLGEGDALVTNLHHTLSIRTADCLPILLVDSRTHAVAAVHAGWRGTVARIVEETLQRMRLEFGTDPGSVYAAIGPGIGKCCYQVGADVARQLGEDLADGSKCQLDLKQYNLRQMTTAGVPRTQIDDLGLCTFCDAANFHSYRRDGESAGRMITFIRRLDEPGDG